MSSRQNMLNADIVASPSPPPSDTINPSLLSSCSSGSPTPSSPPPPHTHQAQTIMNRPLRLNTKKATVSPSTSQSPASSTFMAQLGPEELQLEQRVCRLESLIAQVAKHRAAFIKHVEAKRKACRERYEQKQLDKNDKQRSLDIAVSRQATLVEKPTLTIEDNATTDASKKRAIREWLLSS